MTKVFTTLLEGSPSQIHDEIFKSLNDIVEIHLQEQKKLTIAKVFEGTANESLKPVQRKLWTKATIREALEEIALNGLNENYSDLQGMHKTLTSKGFNLVTSSGTKSGNHGNYYRHPNGHEATINNKKEYQLVLGNGSHLTGNSHTNLKQHLTHLAETY